MQKNVLKILLYVLYFLEIKNWKGRTSWAYSRGKYNSLIASEYSRLSFLSAAGTFRERDMKTESNIYRKSDTVEPP